MPERRPRHLLGARVNRPSSVEGVFTRSCCSVVSRWCQKAPVGVRGLASFLYICSYYLSGGTRIRTGDTMIFSHMKRGSPEFDVPLVPKDKPSWGSAGSHEYASCHSYCCRYCCHTAAPEVVCLRPRLRRLPGTMRWWRARHREVRYPASCIFILENHRLWSAFSVRAGM